MRHLLTITIVLTIIIGCTSKIKDSITLPKQTDTQIASIHIVNNNESLYKIATKYGITQEMLIESNPILKSKKLKKGMKLYIPLATTIKKEEEKPQEDTIKSIIEQPVKKEDSKTVKVAVILPFMLDKYAPSEQKRMIEFYEGFLLAVESLKNEGYSFEIQTYDSGESTKDLNTLINNGKLNECDIILGALYPEHNKQLAAFAKSHDIPLVLPFTTKEDIIYSNPQAYITNALQTYIVEKSVEKFIKMYSDANIIFIKDPYEIEEKEFAEQLAKKIKKQNISHTSITTDSLINIVNRNSNELITDYMKSDTTNIFIPTSSKLETFNSILPTMLVLKRDTLENIPDFILFGYPEWQIYANNNLEAMYEVDTYFYTSFFTNNVLPEAVNIQTRYATWYNRSMQNRYPRYGMLGYDIGYYFLKAISIYGNNMNKNINNIEFTPCQSGFHFTRKNNQGSFINDKTYFIRYSPDYKVTKIDLD